MTLLMALYVYYKIYKCFYDVINDIIHILQNSINIFNDVMHMMPNVNHY